MTTLNGADGNPAQTPTLAPTSVRLVRAIEFSAAYRYHDASLSERENRELYGSLYRDRGFGENFRLEAHVEGSIDPLTGMIVNLVDVDRWLRALVATLENRYLNGCQEVFGARAPTPERIAFYCFEKLRSLMAQDVSQTTVSSTASPRLCKVRLYEGEELFVEVSPPTPLG